MPTYGYQCGRCGHQFEIRQSMSDAPLKDCPQCGGELSKLLYPVGVQFKGSGFYTTDYRTSSESSKAAANGSEEKSNSTSSPSSSNGSDSGTSADSGTSSGSASEKKNASEKKKSEPTASKE